MATPQDNQPLENTFDSSLVATPNQAASRGRAWVSGTPYETPASKPLFQNVGAAPRGPVWGATQPSDQGHAGRQPVQPLAKPATPGPVVASANPQPDSWGSEGLKPQITIMPGATQERQKGAGDAGGNTTSTGVTDPNQGPVSNAASAAPQLQAGERYPGQNTVTLAGQNVRGDVGAAQAEQRVQDAINLSAAQAADAAGRPDYRQQQMDRSAARVANWHAEMDKYDVKGGIGNRRAAMEAAALSAANARDANARVALNEAANMRPVPGAAPRNLVQEEIAKQGAATTAEDKASEQINRGILAPAEAGLRTAQAGLAGAQTTETGAKTEAQKQMNQMLQQYGAAKTPEERLALARNIMLAHGQNPEGWVMQHMAGGNDPNNPMVRFPDTVTAMQPGTGKMMFITPNGVHEVNPQGGQQVDQAKDSWMTRARAANPGMTDAALEAEYAKKQKAQ